MNFVCLPFSQLNTQQLYDILHLRSEVFVLEQTCLYQDMDYKDTKQGVQHLMMLEDEKLIGYARLLPKNLSYPTPSIGRILIADYARNRHLGRKMIEEAIEQTKATWPNAAITIGAQSHLSALYQSCGFVEISAHYMEDGISHVDMRIEVV